MTEKEAEENLFHLIHINTYLDLNKEEFKIKNETLIKWSESTDTVIKALEQKDKIIDLMQNDLFEVYQKRSGTMFSLFGERFCKYKDCTDIEITCKECIKEYYEKKVRNK